MHRNATDTLTRFALLRAVGELCRSDGDLARVVQRWGAPPLWARRPGFATLIGIVLEQQVSLASARAAFDRLQHTLSRITPQRFLGLSNRRLHSIGFSKQKAAYCRGIAQQIVDGELDLAYLGRADDHAARTRLTAIRGVGPWTADIYLLMALRRPDVWPEGDLALVSAARRLKRLRSQPSSDRLRTIASTWSPWRSVAARILWHFYLSARKGRVWSAP